MAKSGKNEQSPSPVIKTGKAPRSDLTEAVVSSLKRSGSWESARIAGAYLKRAS